MNNSPETTQKKKSSKQEQIIIKVLVFLGIIFFLMGIFMPARSRPRYYATRLPCGSNMKELGMVMLIYANDNKGKYPESDQWCDLLIKDPNVPETSFVCPANKKARSTYAINPNCEPNSPDDMVLLFETKAGWNQQGGPELLTTENHQDKGSNILFNDGTVKFIRTEELQTLKWKP